MARAIVQETQQLETDLNEERSRYQNLLTEHLRLEEKYDDLKEAMASSVSETCASIFILIIQMPLNLIWKHSEQIYSVFLIWLFYQAECTAGTWVCRWFILKVLFSVSSVECLQAWPQENRFHPQQQRIRVHLQLRVRRIGRRFPCRRSKNIGIKYNHISEVKAFMAFRFNVLHAAYALS